jgi:small subunit ribosomal protein S3
MGQKVHPKGFRLGYSADHLAVWYSDKQNFVKNLKIDFNIRSYIYDSFKNSFVSEISVERKRNVIFLTVKSARPGTLIGKKGEGIDKIKKHIKSITGEIAHISVVSIKHADLDAKLVANNICRQLEKRVMFRRAMKKAIQSAVRLGALGIKIRVSGRLGGAEIARNESQKEGRMPLHTIKSSIDYSIEEALTTYGIIGVKVWIYKGDIVK